MMKYFKLLNMIPKPHHQNQNSSFITKLPYLRLVTKQNQFAILCSTRSSAINRKKQWKKIIRAKKPNAKITKQYILTNPITEIQYCKTKAIILKKNRLVKISENCYDTTEERIFRNTNLLFKRNIYIILKYLSAIFF